MLNVHFKLHVYECHCMLLYVFPMLKSKIISFKVASFVIIPSSLLFYLMFSMHVVYIAFWVFLCNVPSTMYVSLISICFMKKIENSLRWLVIVIWGRTIKSQFLLFKKVLIFWWNKWGEKSYLGQGTLHGIALLCHSNGMSIHEH